MGKINTFKFKHTHPFTLESGAVLEKIEVCYHTIGTLHPNSKIIWVCHALTANSDVSDWWEGLFGKDRLFASSEYFIICANVLGSCYGTTGPTSPYLSKKQRLLNFPLCTTRDAAQIHDILRSHLQIEKIDLLIGSSLGGQQAQEFAYILQNKLKKLLLIATNAKHSPFGIAFNESQRLALQCDDSFDSENELGGQKGLLAARSIAMLSYRSYSGYKSTQSEDDLEKIDTFKASSYQRYQGQKLVNRFNAYSYWTLTKMMDSHNIGRMRGSCEIALNKISAKTLVIGISSDILFPIEEQEYLATHINNVKLEIIDSMFGHDGFLVETKKLEKIITEFLN